MCYGETLKPGDKALLDFSDVPRILFLLAGSPVRILMMTFALQIVLSLVQLETFTVGIGILSLRADDLLSIWFVWLWILALPDRSMKGVRIGLQGMLIILFLLIFAISAYRGLAAKESAVH